MHIHTCSNYCSWSYGVLQYVVSWIIAKVRRGGGDTGARFHWHIFTCSTISVCLQVRMFITPSGDDATCVLPGTTSQGLTGVSQLEPSQDQYSGTVSLLLVTVYCVLLHTLLLVKVYTSSLFGIAEILFYSGSAARGHCKCTGQL